MQRGVVRLPWMQKLIGETSESYISVIIVLSSAEFFPASSQGVAGPLISEHVWH